jgi:hypothetical protein
MKALRGWLLAAFALGIAWAQFRELGSPELAARVEIDIQPAMPARIYFQKDGRDFRPAPVDAVLPLHVDTFYRDRVWRRAENPETLEVAAQGKSHTLLLRGKATYTLPAAKYRVEAYRGHFYTPASAEFEVKAGEARRVTLKLESWAGTDREQWISGDDHIHLTRGPEDDAIFLDWLRAEDLTVGNFLQLQRQMDAAPQHSWGKDGEKRSGEYTIRSGQELRAEFYGHTNLLGGRELLRPVSVGAMYANTPEAYPYPAVWFRRARDLGATVGYAHFHGSMPHSTFLMDLALGNIHFLEVFQFGVLHTERWYELLNAGLKFTGIAGSDFPVPINRHRPWPHWLPLLGPERALVKRRAGESSYDAWARGVREGDVIVTNGPLVELEVRDGTATARARFYRPLERVQIVRNGEVVASVEGDGRRTELVAQSKIADAESCWVAARTSAVKEKNEPDIQAHTNPRYVLKDGKAVVAPAARDRVAAQWRAEMDYYRKAGLIFGRDEQKRQFFADAERALARLQEP